jgi:hypothetical protein
VIEYHGNAMIRIAPIYKKETSGPPYYSVSWEIAAADISVTDLRTMKTVNMHRCMLTAEKDEKVVFLTKENSFLDGPSKKTVEEDVTIMIEMINEKNKRARIE